MAARIIDGAALAAQIRQQIQQRVSQLVQAGKPVHLAAIVAGSSPAAELYARRQEDACRSVGIAYELLKLPPDVSAQHVLQTIEKLNRDPAVTGIMLLQPIPDHLDATQLQAGIDPLKDVEGVNPANLGYLVCGRPINVPCTALAAFELVKATAVPIRGAEAVVVGASQIVGKPVALLLSDERATVMICRSATADLPAHTRRADILVVAVGKPALIGSDHVKEGAVVIDVGINRITLPDGARKTVGDVDFDAVKDTAGWITPVPGGVGPMTVAMLLGNTLRSSELLARRSTEADQMPGAAHRRPR